VSKGDSVINVTIKGDAKDLNAALGSAEKKAGGFASNIGTAAKAAGGILIAGAAVGTAFEFVSGALEKSDAFGDSMDRLAGTIGQVDAQKIKDIAFNMSDIGLSADEVATLAASFADLATAAGVSAPAIANATPDMLKIAAAVAATTGKTIDEVVTDIGKAANGAQKPVSDLGVVVDSTLNPDEQLTSILEQLKAKFPDVAAATGDLAGKQDALNAKWDNFTIKVGDALDGPLQGVLDFMLTIVDRDIPNMMRGFDELGANITGFGRTVLGPLGNVRDVLGGIGDLIANINRIDITHLGQGGHSDGEAADTIRRFRERNGLSGTLGNP